MNCCDDYGACNRGPGCPAGSIVASKLLADEQLPELEPYEFGPERFCFIEPDPEPDASEPWLTPARVLVGFLVFLAVCDLCAMAALYFWR